MGNLFISLSPLTMTWLEEWRLVMGEISNTTTSSNVNFLSASFWCGSGSDFPFWCWSGSRSYRKFYACWGKKIGKYLLTPLCQFTLFCSKFHFRLIGIVIFNISDSKLKASGKMYNLALHLVEMDANPEIRQNDADPSVSGSAALMNSLKVRKREIL